MPIKVRKAKTAKGARILRKREPKAIEDEKKAVFFKTTTASSLINNVLVDFCALKKPEGKLLTHRNPLMPFEDSSSVEFLTQVNDSSLFMIGSHSKKRPQALTIGRTFDGQILDMMEFLVDPTSFRSIQALSSTRQSIARLGAKPLLLFVGDAFELSDDLKKFKSLMTDFFHIKNINTVNLVGLDRVLLFTAATDSNDLTKKIVSFRHYNILKDKLNAKCPRIQLDEVGPRLDMTYHRATVGSNDIQRAAMRVARGSKAKKIKNVEKGLMGETLGRLHLEKQNFDQIALKKTKSLGTSKRANIIAPLKPIQHAGREREGTVRGRAYEDDGDFSDDSSKGRQQSTKKQKKLPSAYMNAIISE